MNQFEMWLIVGMSFLILEIFTGAFLMIFLSMGCFAAGIFAALINPAPQFSAIFGAVIALAGALFLRRPLQRKFLTGINLEADIGKEIQIDRNISPHEQARIMYQGTTWLATNLDSQDIKHGDRVVIAGIDGNVLLIRKSH